MDAWFVGFQPNLVAAVWVGYDNPRNLGSRETGGGLSLPIWISFMQEALKNVPVAELPVPPGVVSLNGDWYFEEFAPGNGIAKLNQTEGEAIPATNAAQDPIAPEERKGILDMFRN